MTLELVRSATRGNARSIQSEAGPAVRTSRARLSGLGTFVLVVGVIITAVLTVSSRLSYLHNESRLTQLQSALTADALGVAPVDVERRLGQALTAASQSPDPVGAFRTSIAASMTPKGPFSSAALTLVSRSKIKILALVGEKPLRPPTSSAAVTFFDQVVKSPVLVTTRVVSKSVQRLGFGLQIRTANGALVASASEELPLNRVTAVPSSSPDYGFNVAIYFGKATVQAALLLKTTNNLPIQGTVAREAVPFGSSTLTLVMSPKRPLTGTWSALLPWGILILGLLFTIGVAILVERLVRRRRSADSLVDEEADCTTSSARSQRRCNARYCRSDFRAFPALRLPADIYPANKALKSEAIGTASSNRTRASSPSSWVMSRVVA